MSQSANILVYGTGIAGMVAAWHAMELGAKVTLAGMVDPLQAADARWRTGFCLPERALNLAELIFTASGALVDARAVTGLTQSLEQNLHLLGRLGVRFALSAEGQLQSVMAQGQGSGKLALTWSLGRQILSALSGRLRGFVNSGQLRMLSGHHFLAPLLTDSGRVTGVLLQRSCDLTITPHLVDALIVCDSDRGGLFNSLDDLRTGQVSAALYKSGAALANLEFMAKAPVFMSSWGRKIPVPECWFGQASSVTETEMVFPSPKNTVLQNEFQRLTVWTGKGDLQISLSEAFVDGLGGLWTDRSFAGNLPGLFVGGEGLSFLHGAKRLPGLAIAECLYSGLEVAKAAMHSVQQGEVRHLVDSAVAEAIQRHEFLTQYYLELSGPENPEDLRDGLTALMLRLFAKPGHKRLFEQARETIGDLRERFHRSAIGDRGHHANQALSRMMALDGLLDLADATVASALCRQESRGQFVRDDFTAEDPLYKKNTKVFWTRSGPRVVYEDCCVGGAD
jgi:succinate dehydrogenase/fumarate reductase flavoprotein subunit